LHLSGRVPSADLLERDQREAGFLIDSTAQVPGRLFGDNLECGPYVCREKMTAARTTVPSADDDVRVHLRLAVLLGDVAEEREYLDLLRERNLEVVLLLAVEVAELDVAGAPMAVKRAAVSARSRANASSSAMTSSPLSKTSAYVRSPFSCRSFAFMQPPSSGAAIRSGSCVALRVCFLQLEPVSGPCEVRLERTRHGLDEAVEEQALDPDMVVEPLQVAQPRCGETDVQVE
jgi:hypothetical protein